jgi:hypothetical protein
MIRYVQRLTTGRIILWCYLAWYLVILFRYFDPAPRLWLTSIGLSAIIGIALVISTRSSSQGTMKLDGWQIFRLFLMPFCVSSFSALVKGQGFILIFSPRLNENLIALGVCGMVLTLVWLIKRTSSAMA